MVFNYKNNKQLEYKSTIDDNPNEYVWFCVIPLKTETTKVSY